MNGIRTYFRRRSKFGSGFRQAYSCLYPLFGGLYFVETVQDSCFHFPWDNDEAFETFSRAWMEKDGPDALYASSVLIANDQFVEDDWNTIVLIETAQLSSNRTLANHVVNASQTRFKSCETRLIFFHNYDGAFWQFFTNDDSFTSVLLAALQANPDLDLRRVNLHEHYPNPGEYRENYPPRV